MRRPLARTKRINRKSCRMAGFSYVEVLIATVIIAMTLVPAMDAFLPGKKGVSHTKLLTQDRFELTAKLEDMLSASFSDIDAAATAAGSQTVASSFSDVVTYPDGHQITRNVFLSRYDGDNADANNNPFDGIDSGLIWIRVEIVESNLSIESLYYESQ